MIPLVSRRVAYKVQSLVKGVPTEGFASGRSGGRVPTKEATPIFVDSYRKVMALDPRVW